jgi:hypothetical protein
MRPAGRNLALRNSGYPACFRRAANGRNPPNCGVQDRDPQRVLYVDSCRPRSLTSAPFAIGFVRAKRGNSGRCRTVRRTCQMRPACRRCRRWRKKINKLGSSQNLPESTLNGVEQFSAEVSWKTELVSERLGGPNVIAVEGDLLPSGRCDVSEKLVGIISPLERNPSAARPR